MKINVGAYWGSRQESLDQCAARLERYLSALRSFPVLADWYLQGGSVRQASGKTPITQFGDGILTELLRAGRNKYDTKPGVIENLGYRVGLWNRRGETESASLLIGCGMYSTNPRLSNAVVLALPSNLETLSTDTQSAIKRLLCVHVEAWNPDWSAVFASQCDAIKNRKGNGPFLDKMLWLKSGTKAPEGLVTEQPVEQVLDGALYTSKTGRR
ncbi:Imm52 family immunity protein [Dyella humi]|uniref:Imm52 family immunity protein n=1 Tax=Dyella humi TaxID=1770547 RepID=UPI00362403F9